MNPQPQHIQFIPHNPYCIVNLTRRTMLADNAFAACTIWSRMVGLLGRTHLSESEGLILPRCQAIHTWFMRMTIDVVVIDGEGRVLRCFPSLGPWRMTIPYLGAWAYVELAQGSIQRSATKVGDQLVIEAATVSRS